ncbi:MAG TPA: hypothetical protein DEQ38_01700 [Elusimicrobia bacterium]|nr:MAG: hypothetical protein A2089_10220 [Elusimicrobia bacterium GWD2_63_28]HCC46822.1 hypothetical protein [Elusimicrobiota bacterium]
MITGERLVLQDKERGFEFARHIFAYEFAAGLAKGLSVLDLGCSEGYGGALLAGTAASVTGLDRSAAAIANAAAAHQAPNLRFVSADATATGLPSSSFDLVCAFQIIEHFSDPAAFLAEIERLLKPGGRAVISTLNREISGSVFNPYHPVEYDRAGFERALRAVFGRAEVLGVFADEGTMKEMRAFKARAAAMLKLDVFGLRRLAGLYPFRRLYDLAVILARLSSRGSRVRAHPHTFNISADGAEKAMDLIAVCVK